MRPSQSDFIEANLRDFGAERRAVSTSASCAIPRATSVVEMREPQSNAQQTAKSYGDRPVSKSGFNETAHLHAHDRLSHGYGINDVVAEYRVLRASVLQRCLLTSRADATAFQEMVRFNEAIDRMLAESVRQYWTHMRPVKVVLAIPRAVPEPERPTVSHAFCMDPSRNLPQMYPCLTQPVDRLNNRRRIIELPASGK